MQKIKKRWLQLPLMSITIFIVILGICLYLRLFFTDAAFLSQFLVTPCDENKKTCNLSVKNQSTSKSTPQKYHSALNIEKDPCSFFLMGTLHYKKEKLVVIRKKHSEQLSKFIFLKLEQSLYERFKILQITHKGMFISMPMNACKKSSNDHSIFVPVGTEFFPLCHSSVKNKTLDSEKKQNCSFDAIDSKEWLNTCELPFDQLILFLHASGCFVYPLDQFSWKLSPKITISLHQNLKKELLRSLRLSELQPCPPTRFNLSSSGLTVDGNSIGEPTSLGVYLQHVLLSECRSEWYETLKNILSPRAKIFFDMNHNRIEIYDDPKYLFIAFNWITKRDQPISQFYLNARLFFCEERIAKNWDIHLLNKQYTQNTCNFKKGKPPEEKRSLFPPLIFDQNLLSSISFTHAEWSHWGLKLFDYLLEQLEQEHKVSLLAKPTFIVRNHQSARLEQYQYLPELIKKRDCNKKADLPSNKSLNLKFEVTPHRLGSSAVALKVNLTQRSDFEQTKKEDSNTILSGANQYHCLETELIVKPGEGTFLGGFIQQNTTSMKKRPSFLRCLPWTDWLYDHKESMQNKKVLILYLCLNEVDLSTYSES